MARQQLYEKRERWALVTGPRLGMLRSACGLARSKMKGKVTHDLSRRQAVEVWERMPLNFPTGRGAHETPHHKARDVKWPGEDEGVRWNDRGVDPARLRKATVPRQLGPLVAKLWLLFSDIQRVGFEVAKRGRDAGFSGALDFKNTNILDVDDLAWARDVVAKERHHDHLEARCGDCIVRADLIAALRYNGVSITWRNAALVWDRLVEDVVAYGGKTDDVKVTFRRFCLWLRDHHPLLNDKDSRRIYIELAQESLFLDKVHFWTPMLDRLHPRGLFRPTTLRVDCAACSSLCGFAPPSSSFRTAPPSSSSSSGVVVFRS